MQHATNSLASPFVVLHCFLLNSATCHCHVAVKAAFTAVAACETLDDHVIHCFERLLPFK
jgi:hypothetical protein